MSDTTHTQPSPHEYAQHQFEHLCQQLRTIKERPMRRELLGECLLSLNPETRTELLSLICLQSPSTPEAAQLLVAFQDQSEASHKLSYHQIREIYQCAHERGLQHVQRLFLSFAPGGDPQEVQPRGHREMEGVPLGERKFLARKMNIHTIEKLLNDPDPTVIRNLLRNPRITEKEVLQIATRRPNLPQVLEEIARAPRWFNLYRIKSALVQNPYTPFSTALQALSFLRSDDLEQVAADNNLHPQLMATAQEYLRLRETPHDP